MKKKNKKKAKQNNKKFIIKVTLQFSNFFLPFPNRIPCFSVTRGKDKKSQSTLCFSTFFYCSHFRFVLYFCTFYCYYYYYYFCAAFFFHKLIWNAISFNRSGFPHSDNKNIQQDIEQGWSGISEKKSIYSLKRMLIINIYSVFIT